MSRIYDALENRDLELRRDRAEIAESAPTIDTMSVALDPSGMEQEMYALYQTIVAAIPDKQHRSVLLIGAHSQEGTSTIARELAKTVSAKIDKSVLLVDCQGSFDEFSYRGVDPSANFEEILGTATGIDKVLCPADRNLCILPFFLWAQSPFVQAKHLESGPAFWRTVTEKYDLVIIDYPQEMLVSGPIMASMVDGTIIVVEAEKTRWQVAVNVKERIIKNGGNVIGAIFNKRQHYVPKVIYDLF